MSASKKMIYGQLFSNKTFDMFDMCDMFDMFDIAHIIS